MPSGCRTGKAVNRMGDEGKAVGSTQAPAALLSAPQFGRGVAARQATLWRVNRFSPCKGDDARRMSQKSHAHVAFHADIQWVS